ncbi:MAG: glycosyltransferase family 2 protein [Pseudodesulfovibrio sp.]|uniref:glycosyltransferase family 2 protein n=1 Tax=Pseudodesulfovibrio sp. TaxID=2035812 RepID=UPI003D0B826F
MSLLVSVIMPAFNSERFIEKALLSVVSQGIDNMDVLVIDDRSTDGTGEIVSRLQRDFPQIRMVRNERGKGPAGARNTGLAQARGRYVAFLDSDDLWLPGHLKRTIEFCENDEVDIVFNDFSVIEYETGKHIADWFSNKPRLHALPTREVRSGLHLIEGDIADALLEQSFIHLQAMVIKRERIAGLLFNEELTRAEDTDFCIRLYKYRNCRFAYTKDVTSIYHRHEESLTSLRADKYLLTRKNDLDFLQIYYRDPDFASSRKSLRARLPALLLDYSYWMRKENQYGEAFSSSLKAIRFGGYRAGIQEMGKVCISYCLFKLPKGN